MAPSNVGRSSHDLITAYHKKPTPAGAKAIRLAIKRAHAAKQPAPPKIAFRLANDKLRSGMRALDERVTELQALHHARPSPKLKNKLLNALAEAQEYSDTHFIVSEHFEKYEDEQSESDESHDEGEMEVDDANIKTTIELFENERDKAAAVVHRQWDFLPGSLDKMRQFANATHHLHAQYLRLVYGEGKTTPTPIPRKKIADGSPLEFVAKAAALNKLMKEKLEADNAYIQDKGEAAKKVMDDLTTKFKENQKQFNEWSQDNLSTTDADGVSDTPTHFRYYSEDGEYPHEGGEVPDVGLSISQLNRLRGMMQIAKHMKRPKAQTSIQPYLARSAVPVSTAPAAFRDRFLAFQVSPGIYRLAPRSDYFAWDRETCLSMDIPNASLANTRLTHNCKNLDAQQKQTLLLALKGIVGVSHRGYHTLNRASALRNGRRIGDCMIRVAWDKQAVTGMLSYRPGLRCTELGEDQVATWEIRTDWQIFRGKALGDWEIYFFAKSNDTGDIPPGGDQSLSKPTRLLKAIKSTQDAEDELSGAERGERSGARTRARVRTEDRAKAKVRARARGKGKKISEMKELEYSDSNESDDGDDTSSDELD